MWVFSSSVPFKIFVISISKFVLQSILVIYITLPKKALLCFTSDEKYSSFPSSGVKSPLGNPAFLKVFMTKVNIYLGDGLFKYFSIKGGEETSFEKSIWVFCRGWDIYFVNNFFLLYKKEFNN